MSNKNIFVVIICLLILQPVQAQPGSIDSALIAKPVFHFQQEYTLDAPVAPAAWQAQKPGLHVSFASTDKAWFRREVPNINPELLRFEETAWKGERVNSMILLWTTDTIEQVRFVISDLKSRDGKIMSKSNLSLRLVRYVLSNYPYDANDVSCGEGPVDKAWLMPDRLESFDRFDMQGQSVRPVWLSVNIPATAVAGVYDGSIQIFSSKGRADLSLSIRVQNQTLPKPYDWSFRLDLWQNPWVIAEYYHVKPWSAEHTTLLEQHLKLYADAGGKFITTYAVHSPWADNSYMTEGTMIEWIRDKGGKWRFDYSIFDKYVQLAMKMGIDKAITIYTPIPWGERFRYLDEKTGAYVFERWLPTSDTFKTNWNVFLTDLKSHLEKKGWFGKTYIGINENAMEQTLTAIRVVKKHSPKWKITYAGDWHPELNSLLDDYSCVFGKEPGVDDVGSRALKGQTSTYYICCTPPKPNTFVFSPPVEGRWLGWYSMAHGYDGLLRWAYDAWPADPVRDARHLLWPAGDCFMVYPGAATGVHFEKMREGIVDYEKMRIIKAKLKTVKNRNIQAIVEEWEAVLQKINGEKEFNKENMEKDILKGKTLVIQLSELLPGK